MYAVRNDGMGWRAISSLTDVNSDETFSATLPTDSLALVKLAQISTLTKSYQAAVATPINFTSSGGITKTFQCDPPSIDNIQNVILGSGGTLPGGFYWVAADNTHVPFVFADLQGLAAEILAQGWVAFQHLQTQKAAVNAATSVSAVQSVNW